MTRFRTKSGANWRFLLQVRNAALIFMSRESANWQVRQMIAQCRLTPDALRV